MIAELCDVIRTLLRNILKTKANKLHKNLQQKKHIRIRDIGFIETIEIYGRYLDLNNVLHPNELVAGYHRSEDIKVIS